jgi:hypothetical protein
MGLQFSKTNPSDRRPLGSGMGQPKLRYDFTMPNTVFSINGSRDFTYIPRAGVAPTSQ